MKLNIHSNQYRQLQRRNSKYIKQLRKRATKSERVFKGFLDQNKIYYKFQKGFLTPFHRIVDFYIPYLQIIIEIDGSSHDLIKSKDDNKDYVFLAKRGLKTIRIKNEEVLDGSFKYREDIKALIASAPKKPSKKVRRERPRVPKWDSPKQLRGIALIFAGF